jgi:tetratricopeptide (TPR) repeat protein
MGTWTRKHLGTSLGVTMLLIAAIGTGGCSAYEKSGAKRGSKTKVKVVKSEDGKKIPLQVREPARPNLGETDSPQRQASMQVVYQGLGLMQQRHLDQAAQRFQEAATIDGANGIAYYYLAWTQYELGNFVQASGILDRAEGLLGRTAEWELRITALREQISIKSQRQEAIRTM